MNPPFSFSLSCLQHCACSDCTKAEVVDVFAGLELSFADEIAEIRQTYGHGPIPEESRTIPSAVVGELCYIWDQETGSAVPLQVFIRTSKGAFRESLQLLADLRDDGETDETFDEAMFEDVPDY